MGSQHSLTVTHTPLFRTQSDLLSLPCTRRPRRMHRNSRSTVWCDRHDVPSFQNELLSSAAHAAAETRHGGADTATTTMATRLASLATQNTSGRCGAKCGSRSERCQGVPPQQRCQVIGRTERWSAGRMPRMPHGLQHGRDMDRFDMHEMARRGRHDDDMEVPPSRSHLPLCNG